MIISQIPNMVHLTSALAPVIALVLAYLIISFLKKG